MHERGLAGLRDEQHAEVSEEAAVELVATAAGRGAGGAHHHLLQRLPEQLPPVVQAAKVQHLSETTQMTRLSESGSSTGRLQKIDGGLLAMENGVSPSCPALE